MARSGQAPSERSAARTRPAAWKLLLVAVVPTFILLLVMEAVSFVYLASRIGLGGNLAFHPLLRSQPYKSVTFYALRFMFDPFLGYRYVPNEKYNVLEINAQGFIGNGTPFPDLSHKPPGVTRVFIFGGSSVAGSGASSNATTIAGFLERILNRARGGGRFEVINAGVDGYTAFQELVYFLTNIHRYHPDVVIFYDGFNDFAYPCWAGGYVNDYQKECCWPNFHEYALYMSVALSRTEENSRRLVNFGVLLDKSYTTILLQRIASRLRGSGGEVAGQIDVRKLPGKVLLTPAEAARRYLDAVHSSIAAVSGRGVRALYALQPTILNKQSMTDEERGLLGRRRGSDPAADIPHAVRSYYQAAGDGLRALARMHPSGTVRVVDLSLDVWTQTKETVYVDGVHTNDRGNEIIARRLADLVQELAP
jgi:lysophospholipase L1-like esterase